MYMSEMGGTIKRNDPRADVLKSVGIIHKDRFWRDRDNHTGSRIKPLKVQIPGQ